MKKIKFPILLKVIFAGLLVSFVASGVAFWISYENQVKTARATLYNNLDSASSNLENYYNNQTNVSCLIEIKSHVKTGNGVHVGYDQRIIDGTELALDDPQFHNNFNEFEQYYKDFDNYIYDNGFGFFPAKAEFQGKYNTLTSGLLTAKISSDAIAAYCAYPESDNRIVFLADSRQIEYEGIEYPPFYHLAGSYYDFKDKEAKPKSVNENGHTVKIYNKTCMVVPIFKDDAKTDLVSYVFIEYNEATFIAGVNKIIGSEILILAITATAIVLVYGVISYFLFIRNINKLSKASREITDKLKNNKFDKPIEISIRSHDEMSTLALSLDTLQSAVSDYAEQVKKEASEKERLNAELEVASKIQLEALPPSSFVDDKVSLKAYIKTAKEVGGDFYDYFYIDESRFAVLIADVSGKGIPASLFMMRSKAIIKNEILSNSNLEEAIYKANNILVANNKENLFVTAFIGVIDFNKNEMTYVNSGHEKPYIISQKKVKKLDGVSNFVIGEIDNFNYQVEKVKFSKDDILFMFTDGLNESINKKKEEFGYKRIEDILLENKGSLDELINIINQKHTEFIEGELQFDDITMLMIKMGNNNLHLSFNKKDYSIIEEATNKFFESYKDLSVETKAHVGIVLDELLNNIVSYEKEVDIKIDVDFIYENKELTITISSNGEEYDPFKNNKPKDSKNTEIGGHGINIVKNFAKKYKHQYINGNNVLTLVF